MRIVQFSVDPRRDMLRLQALYDDMASVKFQKHQPWRLRFIDMVQHFCGRRFGFQLALQSRLSFLKLASDIDPETKAAMDGIAEHTLQAFSFYRLKEVCFFVLHMS
jgi:hypothetical protein